MCTYLTEKLDLEGSGKGAAGWFTLSQATVYLDHPQHAPAEHTLNIDFLNPQQGPSARVAVELTAQSARALAAAIESALPPRRRAWSEPSGAGPPRVPLTGGRPGGMSVGRARIGLAKGGGMKFRVEHDALADVVAWVARALPSRPVMPVLAGLRLEAGDGLTLSCFDYDLAATARVAADVAEPGTALVPGRLLAEITRSLPEQPAEFTADGDVVSLTCGSAEFALVSLPLADYPELPPTPPVAGTIDGGDLAAAVAQVLPAASRDDTLPMLTAVCLDIRGESLTLAATDRYRLAVRELQWEPAHPGLRAIALVPARTLADAARTMTPGEPVPVAFTPGDEPAGERDPHPVEGMISFECRGRRLTGRLIGGEFIRYQSRFPDRYGCRAEVPAAPFIEAVRRVSLVADRASPVRLTFSQDQMVVEAQTEGRARAAEAVAASFEGDEPAIAFNPHYLLDGLTAAAAGSGPARQPADTEATPAPATAAIRLEFTSPAKPALITLAGEGGEEPGGEDGEAGPAAGPSFRYLVVPLRSPTRA